MGLFQIISNWVSSAWNWLNRFFKKLWGYIQSWWGKLRGHVAEALNEFIEVVILDRRQQGGRELWDIIKENQPTTITLGQIDNYDSKMSVGINRDGSVGKIDNLDAHAAQRDQYDAYAEQNNGIIRING